MKITTVRRISQGFFLVLFLWFTVVSSLGTGWSELRGWPVNWFLELDPLVGLATLLSTHTLYRGLAWGVATVVLTMFLGRFFLRLGLPFRYPAAGNRFCRPSRQIGNRKSGFESLSSRSVRQIWGVDFSVDGCCRRFSRFSDPSAGSSF